MPLVAHIDLPTFQRLREEGEEILAPDRASQSGHQGNAYRSAQYDARCRIGSDRKTIFPAGGRM